MLLKYILASSLFIGGVLLSIYAIRREGRKYEKLTHEKEQATLRAESAERVATILTSGDWSARLQNHANTNTKD
jgi:hypothetical protein